MTEEEAIAETQQQTRRYAKRQWTWFRRERDIEWLCGFGTDPEVQSEAVKKIAEFPAQRRETFF
jgi:tRNA dimethylallyltransferase